MAPFPESSSSLSSPDRDVRALEKLVTQLDSAIRKRTEASDLGLVKVQRAEANLFGLLPEIRNVMLQALKDPIDTDRSRLIKLFGDHCSRLARIRAVFDAMRSLRTVLEDKRVRDLFSTAVRALQSVEAVLKDLGQGKTRNVSPNRGIQPLTQVRIRSRSPEVERRVRPSIPVVPLGSVAVAGSFSQNIIGAAREAHESSSEADTYIQEAAIHTQETESPLVVIGPETAPGLADPLEQPPKDSLGDHLLGKASPDIITKEMEDLNDQRPGLSESPAADSDLDLNDQRPGLSEMPAMDSDAAKIKHAIQTGELREVAFRIFSDLDTSNAELLDWNSRKIPNFITQVLDELRVSVQPTDPQMYAMYDRFDKHGKWGLNMDDCVNLIEAISHSLQKDVRLQIENRARVLEVLESREQLAALTERLFKDANTCNLANTPRNSDELRALLASVFNTFDVPMPSDPCLLTAYWSSDFDQCVDSLSMSDTGLSECRKLVRMLLQAFDEVKGRDDDTFCDAGHAMQLIVTKLPGSRCTLCNGPFKEKVAVWQCHLCDYRMCVKCHKQLRSEREEHGFGVLS